MKTTLRMYDDCSEVDIASMMNGINTRIQNLTRNTAQRWLRGFSKASETGENNSPSESEMEDFQRIVGPQLANTLISPPPQRSRCVVVLLPLAWAIQSYWGPIGYAIGITVLESMFCLGTNCDSVNIVILTLTYRSDMANEPCEYTSRILSW